MPYFRVFTAARCSTLNFNFYTVSTRVIARFLWLCRDGRENFLRAVHPKIARMKGQWPSVGGGEEREGNETPCLQAYHINPEREII